MSLRGRGIISTKGTLEFSQRVLFFLAHLEMGTFLIEMHLQSNINYMLVAHLLETVIILS